MIGGGKAFIAGSVFVLFFGITGMIACSTGDSRPQTTPTPAPDFSLLIPPPASIPSGINGSVDIRVSRSNGHSAAIALSLLSNSQGITGSGVVSQGATSGAMSLLVPSTVPLGSHSLSLQGSDGISTHTAAFSLTILPAPLSILSFSANPSTIAVGQSSLLSWNASGAKTLKLDPGNMDVSGTDRQIVSPSSTTTYTLTADNGVESTSSTTTVTVAVPVSLVASYKLEGNFRDSSPNSYHLLPRTELNQMFVKDEFLGSDNRCLGPTAEILDQNGATRDGIPSDTTQGYTICGFVKDLNNTDGTELFVFQDGTGKRLGITASWGQINLEVGTRISTGKRLPDFTYKGTSALNAGPWNHIALVIPPVTSGLGYDFYLNGKKVFQGKASDITYATSYGRFHLASFPGRNLSGTYFDEVLLFQQALSPGEILDLASCGNQEKNLKDAELDLLNLFWANRERGITEIEPRCALKIHHITHQWICVVGDYNDFFRDRLKTEFKTYAGNADQSQPDPEEYWPQKLYSGLFQFVEREYVPRIKHNFENKGFFRITDVAAGRDIEVKGIGYWVNAIGLSHAHRVLDDAKVSFRPLHAVTTELAHYSYLNLGEALVQGKLYSLRTQNGEQINFIYDETQLVSYAIKVNQVGYMPDAGQKFGYVGLWLATQGRLDLSPYKDGLHPFFLMKEHPAVGENPVAFEGRVKARFAPGEDVYQDERIEDGTTLPVNGEDLLELDFSAVTTPGDYYLYVPGIGRSWAFQISQDAMGEIFYTQARALFHQRCGIAKEATHTDWTQDACHTNTYFAKFVSEYSGDGGPKDGYRDAKDQPVDVGQNPFELIALTKDTSIVYAGVHGGWHDAADSDRRPTHLEGVEDLLEAFIVAPEKFKDSQLHIPESGNGIPDLLDEALWGMEVWRKAQRSHGGVGLRIETTGHIDDGDFCLALPTRKDSMRYASTAALLARALKMVDFPLAQQKSQEYYDSAVKAYEYARNPANRTLFSWVQDGQTFTYREPQPDVDDLATHTFYSLDAGDTFRAALNLYFLSGKDPKYREAMMQNEAAFQYDVTQMWWHSKRSAQYIELALAPEDLPEYYAFYVKQVRGESDALLQKMKKLPYRDAIKAPDDPWYYALGWGNSLALVETRCFVTAYYLTKNTDPIAAQTYRNAALQQVDYQMGANPLGKPWTTGLGKTCPVNLLHWPSQKDDKLEPVPGITVFGITGSIPRTVPEMVFRVGSFSLVPNTLSGGNDSLTEEEIQTRVYGMLPIWRRYWSLDDYNVGQNEFTINETITPAVFYAGALLGDNWMPSEALKNRKALQDKHQLKGYVPQP